MASTNNRSRLRPGLRLWGCCFFLLLAARPLAAQEYLFATLRRLTHAEEQLALSSTPENAAPLAWLRGEKNHLILSISNTPDGRVRKDIAEVETLLEEVRSLTGRAYVLATTPPPPPFSRLTVETLTAIYEEWTVRQLHACLVYEGALRTLTPTINWQIALLQENNAVATAAPVTSLKPTDGPPLTELLKLPRMPYTRTALSGLSFAIDTSIVVSKLANGKLDSVVLRLETVQAESPLVLDTLTHWAKHQISDRFQALREVGVNPTSCQAAFQVTGFTADKVRSQLELALAVQHLEEPFFKYSVSYRPVPTKNNLCKITAQIACSCLMPRVK